MKKITAVLLNYNYGQYLKDRLDSILNQGYPIYELLILDDHSTDNSTQIIKQKMNEIQQKYPNFKVRCEFNQKNSGKVFKQWEKAFELATGDYIWICEADDLCEKDFLENVMKGFDDPEVVLSYSESCAIDLDGAVVEGNLKAWNPMFDTSRWNNDYINNGKKELAEVLAVKNTIPNASGVVIKKDPKINFKEYLKTSQTLRLTGDWYLYSSILQFGKISYCAKVLNRHRVHSDSVLGSIDKKSHLKEEQFNQKHVASLVKVSGKTQKIIDAYDNEFKVAIKFAESGVKVSVLVPIYNVEKYLPQCLDSLIKQTLKEIEIICINDGSTDNSLKIIKEYAKKDKRIVIIDKKNSGYGDSMNQGLEKAVGEYIGIVESDDFIEHDAFEKMYKQAKKFKAEAVRANYYHHHNGGDTLYQAVKPHEANRLFDPAIEPRIFLEPPAIWSAIYRHDLLVLKDIKFLPTPGAAYQDTGFNFKVWASVHGAVCMNDSFLHYRTDNEASSVNQPDKVMNISKEFAEIERYLVKENLIWNLGGLMEWVKFRRYYWNLQRLAPKLAEDFIDVMRQEFKQAEKQGLLQLIYFNQKEKLAYKMIMNWDKSKIVKLINMRKALKYGEGK